MMNTGTVKEFGTSFVFLGEIAFIGLFPIIALILIFNNSSESKQSLEKLLLRIILDR